MPYCINPQCGPNREFGEDKLFCPTCETPLRIDNPMLNEEFYWLIKCLIPLGDGRKIEVFKAVDSRGRQKVVKCLNSNSQEDKRLLRQESECLIILSNSEYRRVFPVSRQGEFFPYTIKATGQKLDCLVMEYIKGKNLQQYLEENGPISQEITLNWLKKLAKILSYVHHRYNNFIHRDIKPLNIMLRDEQDEQDEQLVLIDFNAAKLLNWQATTHNRSDTGVCTLNYAAPEQLTGQTVSKSDVFSLGCTFIYLLTGNTDPKNLIDAQTGKVNWTNHCRQNISTSLLELIDRMVVESPEARLDSSEIIQEVDEISRTLNSSTNQSEIEPAPPINAPEGEPASSPPPIQSPSNSPQTQSPATNALESERTSPNPPQTEPTVPKTPESPFRPLSWLRPWLDRFHRWNQQNVIIVGFIVGLFVVIMIHQQLNSTLLSNPDPCDLPAPIVNAPNVNDMAFSPDGKYLATVGSNNILRSLNVTDVNKIVQADCELDGSAPNSNGIVDLKFKPNSTKNETILATASLSSGANLWNMKTDGSLSYLKNLLPNVPVVALAFNPQGSYLAIATSEATSENSVKIYDMNNLDNDPKTRKFDQYIKAVNFSQDGEYLATIGLDNKVQWWDSQQWLSGNVDSNPSYETVEIVALTHSPQRNYRALATSNGIVEVWDLNTKPLKIIKKIEYNEYINAVIFSQDENYLAIVGLDNKVQVWEWQYTENGLIYEDDDVVALAFSPIENSNVLTKIDAKGKIEPIPLTKR